MEGLILLEGGGWAKLFPSLIELGTQVLKQAHLPFGRRACSADRAPCHLAGASAVALADLGLEVRGGFPSALYKEILKPPIQTHQIRVCCKKTTPILRNGRSCSLPGAAT